MAKINIDGERTVKKWQSDDGKVKIWEVTEENGTTHQTMSEKIAAGGEFDVEFYKNTKGKTYMRQAQKDKPQYSPDKQFKADPDSRESIEWQTSLKAAVQVAADYFAMTEFTPNNIEDYAKEVDRVAVHFKNLINVKPKSLTSDDTNESEHEKYSDDEYMAKHDDLPPVENYEDLA